MAGFWWQGAVGVTSVRRIQKLPHGRQGPVSAGSNGSLSPQLARAESVSDVVCTSGTAYLRKRKKTAAQQRGELETAL